MSNESTISAQIEKWAQSVADGNRAGILAHHSDDLTMFDFPNTVRGIDAYDKTWQFFDDSRQGPVTFTPRDIKITVGEDVAFASCEIHCDGTTAGPLDLRLTIGFEKRDSEWIVTHEHHSVPTNNETLIGPAAKR